MVRINLTDLGAPQEWRYKAELGSEALSVGALESREAETLPDDSVPRIGEHSALVIEDREPVPVEEAVQRLVMPRGANHGPLTTTTATEMWADMCDGSDEECWTVARASRSQGALRRPSRPDIINPVRSQGCPWRSATAAKPAKSFGRKGTLGGRDDQIASEPLGRKGTLAKCTSDLLVECFHMRAPPAQEGAALMPEKYLFADSLISGASNCSTQPTSQKISYMQGSCSTGFVGDVSELPSHSSWGTAQFDRRFGGVVVADMRSGVVSDAHGPWHHNRLWQDEASECWPAHIADAAVPPIAVGGMDRSADVAPRLMTIGRLGSTSPPLSPRSSVERGLLLKTQEYAVAWTHIQSRLHQLMSVNSVGSDSVPAAPQVPP